MICVLERILLRCVWFEWDPAPFGSGSCLKRSKRAQEMLFKSNTNLSACFLERIMLKLVQTCLSQCKVKTPACVFWKGSCAKHCSNPTQTSVLAFWKGSCSNLSRHACHSEDLVQTCPCMPFAVPGCVIWKGSSSDWFRILFKWVHESPMNTV